MAHRSCNLQRLSTWVWIKLVPGANKARARTASPLPILTRRIPTWLWLMPSCKWPVPMHTRSPCGTSSTVNAPSQHPGRFNPPYTCKHVLRCAYRRVVPASTLPSVAKNRFCCSFLPGSSLGLSRGRTDHVQRQHPQLPRTSRRFLHSLALVDS